MKYPAMVKSQFAFIFFFLFSLVSSGQTTQSDKKAQDILKGVSTKYKSYKSLKATFTIASENPKDNKKDSQKGTIFLMGNRYKLEIAGQDVISDGKTRWTYVKDANEVQIDNLKVDENSITPSNIFTMYEKGWNSKFTGEQKKNGQIFQLIELVPIDAKAKSVFKVKLSINKADKFISSAQIFDKNGNIQLITVDQFLPNAVSDESIFSFNASKFPGAEVIDLR